MIKQAETRVDISRPDLEDLLEQGYTDVEWIWDGSDCEICMSLDGEYWSLEEFLEGLEYDAPIFEHSHVNCKCKVKVSGEGLDTVYVNYLGII